MSIPIKPLDLYETHDKHDYFTKKSDFKIGEVIQKIIDSRPFGDNPFYIFAHARTDENTLQKKILWQPRLFKPSCETNSMLFKVRPGSDEVRIIWMIPEEHLWPEYEKGKVCESSMIAQSIREFKTNKAELEASEPDDPSEEKARGIYKEILEQQEKEKPVTLKDVQSSTSLE